MLVPSLLRPVKPSKIDLLKYSLYVNDITSFAIFILFPGPSLITLKPPYAAADLILTSNGFFYHFLFNKNSFLGKLSFGNF